MRDLAKSRVQGSDHQVLFAEEFGHYQTNAALIVAQDHHAGGFIARRFSQSKESGPVQQSGGLTVNIALQSTLDHRDCVAADAEYSFDTGQWECVRFASNLHQCCAQHAQRDGQLQCKGCTCANAAFDANGSRS